IENVPLHNPACPAEQNADVLEIIYPTENARLWIPREYGGAYQKVTCKAAHRHSSVKLFWYLDDFYLGETVDKHVMSLDLSNGRHTLVIVDAAGRRVTRTFYSTRSE
ncbi:MAG: hypothetical protein KDF60_18235, partial [Calditrichaeota bacterium]|nr:hypothetical protein [Calditrichota bacterium]